MKGELPRAGELAYYMKNIATCSAFQQFHFDRPPAKKARDGSNAVF
jgi:hypothetical protein